MRRAIVALAAVLVAAGAAEARGLVIPVEKSVPPLAMLRHRVEVTIDDQVAVTRLIQTFRNHTNRPLEATYVFPVPKGATVTEFAMWVDGKRVKGELVDAARARQVYTDIVRRTEDPGLLEYLGQDLLRIQVFPVPAKGDQTVEVAYTSVATKDHDLVEYTYPLKTDGKATSTLEEFSLKLTLKSQHPIINIYSPTHAITVTRPGDTEAVVSFEKQQALLDRDFTLYYALGGPAVGLTALTHRPVTGEDGYFLLLVSPRPELSKGQRVPRDVVFVLDTSGSMREDGKLEQAKKALKHGLDGLAEGDRFALIAFATTVNRYRDGLVPVGPEYLAEAKKWVDRLEPTGGTAIDDALKAALELRPATEGRTFTVVFFTDGKPTIGETNADKILANVVQRNTANTRIFTFGVGHDLNATLLDQVAERSRALSTYVRPDEDLEAKVASFFEKISHPVLADLKLSAGPEVSLVEVYPPRLPDLFHGQQLVVLGRYHGAGKAAVKLTGRVGTEVQEFTYAVEFPGKADGKAFVEELWARRKVGYLLEQIRLNGEKKELVDEVVALAKRYGIATPYTSYLVVPDAPVPVAGGPGGPRPQPGMGGPAPAPDALRPGALPGLPPGSGPGRVVDLAKQVQTRPGELADNRSKFEGRRYAELPSGGSGYRPLEEAKAQKEAYDNALRAIRERQYHQLHTDKLGVDLSVQMNNLKNQSRLQNTAQRRVGDRNCLEFGGVWIDEGFDPKMEVVVVKAQSAAYFRILEKHPEVKDVFKLGNYLVWVTPSGKALVIDANDGKDTLTDAEIDALFAKK
jgi:Ca-activated chloride channel family protein